MTDYLRAAAQPNSPLIGLARMMRRAFQRENLRPLGEVLLTRAQTNPQDVNAYMDFATVLLLTGEREAALSVQELAIRLQPLYSLPSHQENPGLRLLVIMGPGDLMANTPIEFLVEESDVALEMLYLTVDSPLPETVPDHDVMLVGIAESDANQPLLQKVAQFIANWPRPVINRPECIAVLSRDGVCAALEGGDDLLLPRTVRTDRETLQSLANGDTELSELLPGDEFPLIARPIGSHAGQDLEKIDTPADLAKYLDRVAHERFYLSRFVDYRGADGQFRKYRIVLIEGVAYICHFAVSSHWMIHYLNAGMEESADKRQQEAECMAQFDQTFALRHAAALAEIHARIGLSYLGIDCAETPDGRLLIFEVDNAMIVHALDSEEMYPYKKPAMKKVFQAFRTMLENARTTAAPE
jgi:hypothetical protein